MNGQFSYLDHNSKNMQLWLGWGGGGWVRYTFCDSLALVCEHFARSRSIAICAHSCNNTTRAFSGRLRAPTVCIFMGHGGRNNVVYRYAHSS